MFARDSLLLLLLVVVVVVVYCGASSEAQRQQPREEKLVCANSFNKYERKEENVRCVSIDRSSQVEFECNLIKRYKLSSALKADVIRSRLVVSPGRFDLNETIFVWTKESSEASSRHHTGHGRTIVGNGLEAKSHTVTLSSDPELKISYSEIRE